MVDSGSTDDASQAQGRDYNDFKALLSDIKRVDSKNLPPGEIPPASFADGQLFRGVVVLGIGGRKLTAENIEDAYGWAGDVAGPKAAASSLLLTSSIAVNPQLPAPDASYFRKAGFRLTPLVCSTVGGASNYSAIYLASAPGKSPAFLRIDLSTGSSGAFFSYIVYLGSVPWSDFPRGQDASPAGLGDCPLKI